jgi:hypothetical protein
MQRLCLLAIFTLLVISQPLVAAMQWERTSATKQASLDQQIVTADFRFTNTGDEPIRISSLRSSCGCTSGQLKKRRYKPDESGAITIRYAIKRGHHGTYSSRVIVRSNDRANPVTTLRLETKLPAVLKFEPTRVSFQPKQGGRTKTVRLTVPEPAAVKAIQLKRLPPWLNATWLTEEGKSMRGSPKPARRQKKSDDSEGQTNPLFYRLRLQATDSKAEARARMIVRATLGNDQTRHRLLDVVTANE